MVSNYRKVIWIFLATLPIYGQNKEEEVFVNKDQIFVGESALIATSYAFDNTETGIVENNGVIYFFNSFNNDNLYYYGKDSKNSMTSFVQQQGEQSLGGSKLSEFYSVEFDNGSSNKGFNLKTEFYIAGKANFKNGIVKVNPSYGALTFSQYAKAIGSSDTSHVQGKVEKIGNEDFEYPIGDENFFRPAIISAPKDIQDAVVAQYRLNDTPFFENHKSTTGAIKKLNDKEYWKLDAKLKSKETVILSLTWDDRTTPSDLLKDPEGELHIVRWDEKQQLWVDEGGVVDMSRRTITTATQVKGYGYFTLASIKTNLILEGDLVIYNFVSTNGDGKNDYFLIDNITRFPNNTVEIYNRWGIKVFDTTNYDSAGNVFKGYSDGRVTLKKGEQLPSGTYFYVITYEYEDSSGSRKVKKSGYLHLETN